MAWIISRQKRARRKEILLHSFYQQKRWYRALSGIFYLPPVTQLYDFERLFCLPGMDILLSLSHDPMFKLEVGIYPSPSTTTDETKLWLRQRKADLTDLIHCKALMWYSRQNPPGKPWWHVVETSSHKLVLSK